MMNTMPDTPSKRAGDKEMGMANADMSNGKMKCLYALYEGAAERDGEVKPAAHSQVEAALPQEEGGLLPSASPRLRESATLKEPCRATRNPMS
jgi:hypothetical protein